MKRAFIILAMFSIVVSSCCDDEGSPTPPVNNCMKGLDDFMELAAEVDDSTFMPCGDTCIVDCEELYSSAIPYDYTEPCFNPKNPEQLAYYRFDNTTLEVGSELWIADFCAGEKKMIVNNALYGLDWSVKDWLIFTADDQNIWKIKANGDSLTQLTFVGDYNRYPKWSPDGERIAFNAEIQGSQYFFIANSNGSVIDTLEELSFSSAWSWIDDNRICYLTLNSNSSKIKSFNIENNETKLLHDIAGDFVEYYVLSTSRLPNQNSIVWCALGVIGKTDLNTGSFTIIKRKLTQEGYWNLSVRPNGEEILINKRTLYSAPNCKYDSEWGFYLIDKDGTNTRKIILP
ncbi:MAG: hypothetical protein EPO28_12370 [Saprospiraceae bacterium]|nr:MAG: hypothetical protein EPO28_12370 [Saprospiraceae bacterium]